MNKETIILLVAIVISLAIGFFAGMYVSAYQNDDPTIGDLIDGAIADEMNDARDRASEARIKSEKRNLVIDILLLESDLGTTRYNWDMEDADNFSLEYIQGIKSELEAELKAQNNQ